MHALQTAHPVVPAAPTPGRHRRSPAAGRRPVRFVELAGRVGSLLTLGALALLGTAFAAGLSAPAPAAERPTVTVTYDVDH